MIKAAVFGDLHLDSAFERLAPSAAASRRLASRGLLPAAVRAAESAGAELILCTGDMFDSQTPYRDTVEGVSDAFASTKLPVFIAPGNHDFYCALSPYNAVRWSENVTLFTSQRPAEAVLPQLGLRVVGVANTEARQSARPLAGWRAPSDGLINILLAHGDISPRTDYMSFPPDDIAAAGFTLAAVGHAHTSAVNRFGGLLIVQNGCMEGRGFDEPGEKGLIIASFGEGEQKAELVPLPGGMRCAVIKGEFQDGDALAAAVLGQAVWPKEQTLLRIELLGASRPDEAELRAMPELEGFLALSIQDKTVRPRPQRDYTADSGLAGLFVRAMARRSDAAATEEERARISLALKLGLAALEGRETL